MAYDVGDTVRLKATFKDIGGTASDPTTITLRVKDPSGNIDSYTYADADLTKSATGVFYYDLALDESGTWVYEFTSTGTPALMEDDDFVVEPVMV